MFGLGSFFWPRRSFFFVFNPTVLFFIFFLIRNVFFFFIGGTFWKSPADESVAFAWLDDESFDSGRAGGNGLG